MLVCLFIMPQSQHTTGNNKQHNTRTHRKVALLSLARLIAASSFLSTADHNARSREMTVRTATRTVRLPLATEAPRPPRRAVSCVLPASPGGTFIRLVRSAALPVGWSVALSLSVGWSVALSLSVGWSVAMEVAVEVAMAAACVP